MTTQQESGSRRSVQVTRTGPGSFVATNARGGSIEVGTTDQGQTRFTPVELLLAAIGGCSGIDVDILTSRRSEPTSFDIEVGAEKVRDADGNHLTDVAMTFRATFPDGEAGDAARTVLPDAVQRSHDRLCTVSRTVELPTLVTVSVEG